MAQETQHLADPDLTEDKLPSLNYCTLVKILGPLTARGVVADGTVPAGLAVARLMDRSRIQRSGLSEGDLFRALEEYRNSSRWTPSKSIELALEHAISVARAPSREREP